MLQIRPSYATFHFDSLGFIQNALGESFNKTLYKILIFYSL